IGQPRPATNSRRRTPSAAARPNALPPVSTTASTRSTRLRGSSRSVSRVPGAPPRTSTPATAPPSGARTTVVPVSQPGSVRVACPTLIPPTSVREFVGPGRTSVAAGVDDAEAVAVRVLEDDEVVLLLWIGPPFDPP